MEYIKENLVDYIFDALETAKKTQAMLPQLPPNIKPIHIRVLHAIERIRDENGYARITDINNILQFLLPNTTKFVNELHQLGLVEKSVLPSDKRVVRIHTTEVGEGYIETYIRKYNYRLHQEFEKIGEANCITLIESINAIYDAVKKVYHEKI